jgi:hypothetical protein
MDRHAQGLRSSQTVKHLHRQQRGGTPLNYLALGAFS